MRDWKAAMSDLATTAEPAPVHVLVDSDYILVQWYVERLQTGLCGGDGSSVELRKFRFEEEGCRGALDACLTLSLFADTSLVLLQDCTAFLANAKSRHDTNELELYLKDPVPGKVLVITVPGGKLDERKKLTKAAKPYPVVDCSLKNEADALPLLSAHGQALGANLTADGLQELWRRSGSVAQGAKELEKLRVYSNGEPITQKTVEELVTTPAEDNVFQWIDGVVKGNLRQSYDALAAVLHSGYDPFALLALLARQFRLMWYAQVLGGQGMSQAAIAGKVGAHPYAVKVAAEQGRHLRPARIETFLRLIADTEYEVKSGQRDPEHALDLVLMACGSGK